MNINLFPKVFWIVPEINVYIQVYIWCMWTNKVLRISNAYYLFLTYQIMPPAFYI